MTENKDITKYKQPGVIFNKLSFASGFVSSKKRKRMGLPENISLKKRTHRRRGKQNLRKKGK